MKAILVIDKMPSACNVCDFNRFTFHWGCSRHNDDSVTNEMEKYIRPSWCPIKPLPKKRDNEELNEYHRDLYADGWNNCLDEIMGETE